jgi:hypothetical protein
MKKIINTKDFFTLGDVIKTTEVHFRFGDSIFLRRKNVDGLITKDCLLRNRIGEITDIYFLHSPQEKIYQVEFIVRNKGILVDRKVHIHSNAITKATKEECNKFLKLKEDMKLQKFACEL